MVEQEAQDAAPKNSQISEVTEPSIPPHSPHITPLQEVPAEIAPNTSSRSDGNAAAVDASAPKHHHLPRMHLHRKRSDKRRVVLPMPGSSTSGAPGNPVEETSKAGDEQTEAVPADEGQKSHVTFMRQVLDWVKDEKQRQRDRATKREAKKAERKSQRSPPQEQAHQVAEVGGVAIPERKLEAGEANYKNLAGTETKESGSPESTSSVVGASTDSLNRLEQIARAGLAASSSSVRLAGLPTGTHKMLSRKPSKKALHPRSRPSTSYSSDTDANAEGDVLVPGCEVVLGLPEKIGWDGFKEEVLKLAHTLRCKGWRRVALERYKELEISRISGALTNAVYMVSPPPVGEAAGEEPATAHTSTKKPAKLLLRIYGAQVSHLIDRERELSILRRLARKKIGPRLFGTFQNGRFEEFFHAETLTKDDIRNPATSKQIAKRMRELHEGIDLEEAEIRAGPVVWLNWEKWVGRAREIMKEVEARDSAGEVLVAWRVFEEAVGKYRKWLINRYGGEEEVKRELVFAHNDTQYGNILRTTPTGDSPLLLPKNTHRQLIVIDFEYASANLPGFEIANHFCEWMANYHASTAPHLLHATRFPTISEQNNFLGAYIGHTLPNARQKLIHRASSSSSSVNTPTLGQFSLDARTPTAIPAHFLLDARTPAGSSASSYKDEEAARQEALDKEVERLREEARAWRPASHAMWAAWGVVQAKIPTGEGKEGEGHPDERGAKNEEGEFDYLGYAQERALFFWGDMISLGVMTEEEVRGAFANSGWERVKRVE